MNSVSCWILKPITQSSRPERRRSQAEWRNPLFPLPRKPKQRKNINPQHSHEVPIPGRDIYDDSPRLNWPVHQRWDGGHQQRDQPTNKVDRMGASQDVKECPTGAGTKIDPATRQFPPGHPLPEEETESQNDGDIQPG